MTRKVYITSEGMRNKSTNFNAADLKPATNDILLHKKHRQWQLHLFLVVQQKQKNPQHVNIKIGVLNIKNPNLYAKMEMDGDMLREMKEKWTRLITEWCPREGSRSKGRQFKRWEDDIKMIAGAEWMRTAKDRTKWKSLEEAYVKRQAVLEEKEPVADIFRFR